MLTKADKSWISQEIATQISTSVISRLDVVMGELQAIREEQAAMFYRQREHTDQLEDHDQRIVKLEVRLV